MKLYNDDELSQILGIHKGTIRRWRMERRIPFTKIGTSVRYTDAQIQEMLHKIPAVSALPAQGAADD